MLKITKAEEPIVVERINLCIYAQPGVGKTSLAFTAESPLLLDFDRGSHRAGNRKDVVLAHSWADAEDISASDLESYKTIILDTAGRALDGLAVDIIAKNPKLGQGGALTQRGFGELKSRFAAFSRLLNSFGKDVVLICHMDEKREGDEVIERLDVQGGSKGEIYKSVDAMGRIFVRGNKRYLDFSPREGSFGKNPGQFGELEFPHPDKNPHFLAETIAAIKGRLNAMNEEHVEARAEVEDWLLAIADMDSVDDFNTMLEQVKKAPPAARVAFNTAAKKKGYAFNKKTQLYEASHVAA